MIFEVFKPKYNSKKQKLSFKLDAGIINDRENDLVTGLKGKALDEVTLFIYDTEASTIENPNTGEPWQPKWYPNGENRDLTGMYMANVDLSGADLKGAKLVSGNFDNADFSGADMTGANITGSSFRNAKFDSAIVQELGTQLYKRCGNADNPYEDNRVLIANGATMENASLIGANLKYALLLSSNFSGANLSGANLSNASIDNNDLYEANFSETNLYQTDFAGQDLLEVASFEDAKWLSTICPNGKLNGGGTGNMGLGGTDLCFYYV